MKRKSKYAGLSPEEKKIQMVAVAKAWAEANRERRNQQHNAQRKMKRTLQHSEKQAARDAVAAEKQANRRLTVEERLAAQIEMARVLANQAA